MPPQMDVIRIEVTEDDIRKGIKFSAHSCPLALALKRALNHPNAWIGPDSFGVADDSLGRTPPTAITFIKTFDGGNKVEPFVFWIPKPLNV